MRVLVTGGRDFTLADEVHRILYPIHTLFGIHELGHGDAEGLDTLAKLWALAIGIEPVPFEVSKHDWDLYGGRAGNMRNSRMLRNFMPHIGVSFPGGPGTADMTEKLIEAGVPTFVGRWQDFNKDRLTWKVVNGKIHG
jgi:hypothetical protein